MLPDRFTDVLDIRSRDDLQRAVVDFAGGLGFDTVAATLVIERWSGAPSFVTIDNMPETYRALFNDTADAVTDPVMQHCKSRVAPIVWDRQTYARADRLPKWERQAAHGIECGIALALHLPDRHHFVIGVERAEALPRNEQAVTKMAAELQLFASFAYEAALPILDPKPAAGPPLSHREIEALRWTRHGKTAWEVGALLGITERTSVKHLQSAMEKLQCATKLQAVLKALDLRLLD